MPSSYCRMAHGVLIIYDITNRNSFDNLGYYINDFNKHAKKYSTFIIVGTKLDLEKDRKVSINEGEVLAKKYNTLYFEVSAKDGTNVNDCFMKLINNMYKIYREAIEKNVVLR